MLFNSLQFAVFFVIVYSLYLILNHRWQNRILLLASYVFYGFWDWRFLSLIAISTVVDYFCGLKIYGSDDNKIRKQFLFLAVFANLSMLGFFKYFNFFVESTQFLLARFGIQVQPHFLNIILPVGISFYTFQTMSYTIDIYRKQMEPTRKFFDFALFVAFFPQLVAGPIERARNLLPQILKPRKLTLDNFYEGCYLIFFGLFQKVFVADNLAKIVDPIFSATPPYNGVNVMIALYAFSFQIFCDFAGYSNIARGLAKCMGFNIMVNFKLPYFSTNPREFWTRWHISLSSWLRDYLYISLGGNRKGKLITYRNLVITMLLGGLWHGATWTFVIWGAYQGLLLIVYRLLIPLVKDIFSPKSALFSNVWYFIRVAFFFQLMCLGWLIFRANSMRQVWVMLHAIMFNFKLFEGSGTGVLTYFWMLITFSWFLIVLQIVQFIKKDLMIVYKANTLVKAMFYVVCFYLTIIFGVSGGNDFIYFQF